MHRESIQAVNLSIDFNASTFDYLVAQLHYPKKTICAVVLYRMTKPIDVVNQREVFKKEFKELLSKLSSRQNLVIMGDFNIRMDERKLRTRKPTNEVMQFNKILEAEKLKQYVIQPTHAGGHILDLVIGR